MSKGKWEQKLQTYVEKFSHKFHLKNHRLGRPRADTTYVLFAILVKIKFGLSYRELSYLRPKYTASTYHFYFNLWSHKGLFNQILALLFKKNFSQAQLNSNTLIIDSSFLPATKNSQNASRIRFYGRKRGFKATLITNQKKLPLALFVHKTTVNDTLILKECLPFIKQLSKKIPVTRLLADKGYDANSIRTSLEKMNISPRISYRRHKNRKIILTAKRWFSWRARIEHCFAHAKIFKVLRTLSSKKYQNILSEIQLSFSLFMIDSS